MAITATTLSAAIGASDVSFLVASATGITAPNFQTGSGIIYLMVDEERMLVLAITGTLVSVVRGYAGTQAQSHLTGSQVQIGNPGDYPIFNEIVGNFMARKETLGAQNLPGIFLAGSADAIDPTLPGFYVVKTAGVDAMTLAAPTLKEEGNVIDVWSDTDQAHTITATSLFAVGGAALKSVATFPAHRGAGVKLRACNLVWHVLSTGGTGTNSGPIVWT